MNVNDPLRQDAQLFVLNHILSLVQNNEMVTIDDNNTIKMWNTTKI